MILIPLFGTVTTMYLCPSPHLPITFLLLNVLLQILPSRIATVTTLSRQHNILSIVLPVDPPFHLYFAKCKYTTAVLDSTNISTVLNFALSSDPYLLSLLEPVFHVIPIFFGICVPCHRLSKELFL